MLVERPGIGQRQGLAHGAGGEALAMHGHTRDREGGPGLPRRQHVAREGQPRREHRLRIVVAADGDHRDAGALQLGELGHQEMAGAPILPIPIVEVAGEQDEADLLLLGELDQVDQRLPRGAPDAVRRRIRIQATQRRIQMQVGGVEEGEVHQANQARTASRRNARSTGLAEGLPARCPQMLGIGLSSASARCAISAALSATRK